MEETESSQNLKLFPSHHLMPDMREKQLSLDYAGRRESNPGPLTYATASRVKVTNNYKLKTKLFFDTFLFRLSRKDSQQMVSTSFDCQELRQLGSTPTQTGRRFPEKSWRRSSRSGGSSRVRCSWRRNRSGPGRSDVCNADQFLLASSGQVRGVRNGGCLESRPPLKNKPRCLMLLKLMQYLA